MTAYVVGVDSALSRTGIGIIEYDGAKCSARTYVVGTGPIDYSDLDERARRITTVSQLAAARIPLYPGELGLLEAPALDAQFGNAWDRAPVWWNIYGTLRRRGTPVATVAPKTLKRWVTGRGGSPKNPVTKSHIVAAMGKMWPGLACTHSELRHHECEALAMAQMCAQHLGWPVTVRAHHGLPLAVVKWPHLLSPC